MIGGITANVSITGNEFAGRGEHTMSPDGCAIDLEGGSDGALIAGNVIHDSYGAGVMLFGLSDPSRNISNAHVHDNVFVRNGGMQTSDDHGELVFMEKGSTGVVENNIFFAMDTDPAFVLRPRVNGSTDGFELRNNSIHPVGDIASHIAPTPALAVIGVDYATQVCLCVCVTCGEDCLALAKGSLTPTIFYFPFCSFDYGLNAGVGASADLPLLRRGWSAGRGARHYGRLVADRRQPRLGARQALHRGPHHRRQRPLLRHRRHADAALAHRHLHCPCPRLHRPAVLVQVQVLVLVSCSEIRV